MRVNVYISTTSGLKILKSAICGLVHHARQTQAYCLTMVLDSKALAKATIPLGYVGKAAHIRKEIIIIGNVGLYTTMIRPANKIQRKQSVIEILKPETMVSLALGFDVCDAQLAL